MTRSESAESACVCRKNWRWKADEREKEKIALPVGELEIVMNATQPLSWAAACNWMNYDSKEQCYLCCVLCGARTIALRRVFCSWSNWICVRATIYRNRTALGESTHFAIESWIKSEQTVINRIIQYEIFRKWSKLQTAHHKIVRKRERENTPTIQPAMQPF